jgi:ABC-type glycerol-3-phosphate transport system permease component
MKIKKIAGYTIKSVLSLIILVLVIFPLAWLLMTAIKTNAEAQAIPVHWIPKKPTIEPIISTWIDKTGYSTEWVKYFLNTIKITIVTTIIVMILGTLIGYGLARFNIKGTPIILIIFIIAQLFTGPALMIPIYALLAKVGLYDTHIGLIIIYILFQTPFAAWLSYSNFQNLPVELEEAATVDGCTQLGAFIRITLPLSRIGIITIGLMSFLLTWSEYPFAVVLLENESKVTISVGLAKFITAVNIYWNQMAAASLIVGVPVLVLLVFAQKYFIKGLSAGAIK